MSGAGAGIKWNKVRQKRSWEFRFSMACFFWQLFAFSFVTRSKNLPGCLHPNAHPQAAEEKLRGKKEHVLPEKGWRKRTALDYGGWDFTGVAKSIIWGNRVKDKQKAGSLPSVCLAGTVICEAPAIISVRFTTEELDQELLLTRGQLPHR